MDYYKWSHKIIGGTNMSDTKLIVQEPIEQEVTKQAIIEQAKKEFGEFFIQWLDKYGDMGAELRIEAIASIKIGEADYWHERTHPVEAAYNNIDDTDVLSMHFLKLLGITNKHKIAIEEMIRLSEEKGEPVETESSIVEE